MVKWEKISVESEEYKRERELSKDVSNALPLDDSIFGKDIVDYYEYTKGISRVTEFSYASEAEQLAKKIDDSKNMFKEVLKKRKEDANLFWGAALADAELSEQIKAAGISPEIDELNNNLEKIPADIYIKIAQKYIEKFEEQELNFESQKGEKVATAIETMHKTLKDFGIDYDLEKMKARIEAVAIRLADPINTTFSDYWGSYSNGSSAVRLRSDLLEPGKINDRNFNKILCHELFHVLSGRVEYKEGEKTKHDQASGEEPGAHDAFDFDIMENGRVGLSFGPFPVGSGRSGEGRFEWLNEAVTETLAQSKQTADDPFLELLANKAYKNERILYRLLLAGGRQAIPENLFIEAYLEDYEPGDRPIPKWKALWKALNDSYEPGILVKLDKLVMARQGNISEAVTYLVKNYPNIKKCLEEEMERGRNDLESAKKMRDAIFAPVKPSVKIKAKKKKKITTLAPSSARGGYSRGD